MAEAKKMKPLWGQAWTGWARRLERAPALALFSDFDGTLAPIVSHPRRARLPAQTREALRRLGREPGVFVAIVSGRPVEELRRLVRLARLAYIGIHGVELAWPGQPVLSRATPTHLARVEEARQALEQRVGNIAGVWVERKISSVAVHYRQAVESRVPGIEQEVGRIARQTADQLVLQSGKRLMELLPAVGASKASAVLSLLDKLPRWLGAVPLPIYLGDDRTDETVFRRLGSRGLTIFVDSNGSRNHSPTARYFLSDPADVRRFLRKLLALRRGTT